MQPEEILKTIISQGMLPLFYNDSEEVTVDIVKNLYDAGIRVFEYTNRGAAAVSNFAKLKEVRDESMPDLILGIGTVKTIEEAEIYTNIGADFIVAPIINVEVGEFCNENNLLWIPGCMTPSEISLAQKYHARLIKLFPANILGPEFVSSIKDLFPGQLFMPTGGVNIEEENIKAWFKSGVCAVGMGSKLISKEIMQNKGYKQLKALTAEAFSIIKKCNV